MPTKLYPKNMQVDESEDKSIVAVSVQSNEAGSSDITFFIYQPLRIDTPFLRGEDYPALVQAWDNKYDDIFDNL